MVIVNHNSVAPANESLVAAGRQDWKSVIYKLLTDLAIKKRFRAAGNARGEPSSLGEQSACADLRRAARDTFYNSKAASRGH